MPYCYLALGGNLGSVEQTFEQALRRLSESPGCALIASSRFYRTAAVGPEAGSTFLNAAAEIDSQLAPLELLERLQSIERDLGRVRSEHWGARTIDLDLVFYGSEIITSPRLVVPHPAAWYRRFVLDPLVEIAPRFVHPERQAEIQTLRDRLLPRPLVVALTGGTSELREALAVRLQPDFPAVRFVLWQGAAPEDAERRDAPAIVFWLGVEGSLPDLGASERQPASGVLAAYDQLPRISRIDAGRAPEPGDDFVRNVLQSALG